jgi:hypothetical protein
MDTPVHSLKELPNAARRSFILSIPEACKCAITADLTGPATLREGQRP